MQSDMSNVHVARSEATNSCAVLLTDSMRQKLWSVLAQNMVPEYSFETKSRARGLAHSR